MSDHERIAFRLDMKSRGPLSRAALATVRPVAERLSGLRSMDALYNRLPRDLRGAELMRAGLRDLDVRVDVRDEDLERIPREGPALLVANHPYGLIEGMILPPLLASRRSDFKLMANYLLSRIPELRELFVYVDPFETSSARRSNTAPLRAAIRYVSGGGLLATFPSGEVAHLDLRSGSVRDPEWSPSVATIARKAQAPVIPVWFSGRNGWPFQALGMLHPRLRTAMLCREVGNRRGQTLQLRIGNPIPWKRLAEMADDHERVAYMRERTEILAHRPAVPVVTATPMQPRRTPEHATPVIAESDPEALEHEIDGLTADQHLVKADGHDVYLARSEQIPGLLREIGRLREITFRAVGEGTGRELDLDRFDEHYRHLFVWDREARELVGAYRLGLVDRILADHGPRGLYTTTLFKFSPRYFEALGPALELGRSFIRVEHQRSYSGLMLLWKGIGRFIAQHPQYVRMFGPVSISAEYQSASQRLIVEFLRQNRYEHEWSRWIRPRRPFKPHPLRGGKLRPEHLADLQDVSAFIGEIESDGKGVPILLRQYLKLGGRLLGFNVDPDFSNVLDVLVLLDVLETERKVVNRYMGREAANAFLAWHRDRQPRTG